MSDDEHPTKTSNPTIKDHTGTEADNHQLSSVSRRSYLAHLAAVSSTLMSYSLTADDKTANGCEPVSEPHVSKPEELEFGFIKQPPGELYSLGDHRLHSWSLGEGDITVIFEPGLGGSALEYVPLAEQVSQQHQVLLYDRAGYGWSDPGVSPRHVLRLARELKQLITLRGVKNKLILVGHSYGGLIMREFAQLAGDQVRGLVLVDSSHEDQFNRLADKDGVSMLPTSDHFVISAPELPHGLRDDVRKKILALSRMRKTYAALHAEISSFKESCDHIRNQNATFDFPVTIISRGVNPAASDDNSTENEAIWQELQTDLLKLSKYSQQRIATESGHHIHIDQPDYITDAITDLS